MGEVVSRDLFFVLYQLTCSVCFFPFGIGVLWVKMFWFQGKTRWDCMGEMVLISGHDLLAVVWVKARFQGRLDGDFKGKTRWGFCGWNSAPFGGLLIRADESYMSIWLEIYFPVKIGFNMYIKMTWFYRCVLLIQTTDRFCNNKS